MEVTGRMKVMRRAFAYTAAAFATSVTVQVFLAGLAIFADASAWIHHAIFVRVFEYLPLLMLIFSFAGRMPSAYRWQSLGMFAMIILMYASANIASGWPLAGAFHPVIALALFWMSVALLPRAWRLAYPTPMR